MAIEESSAASREADFKNPETLRRLYLDEPIALKKIVIECKASSYSTTGPENGARFVLLKHEIEELSGLDFDVGKTYRFEGNVGDLFTFERYRKISNNRYIVINVPKKHLLTIKIGEEYRIRFSSISEASANTTLGCPSIPFGLSDRQATVEPASRPESRPIRGRHLAQAVGKAHRLANDEHGIVFSVFIPRLEREARVKFEVGKNYVIRGKMDDVCEFETRHRERGYSNSLSIVVPKESADNFTLGRKYNLYVDEIQEIIGEPQRYASDSRDRWNWELVATWIDTEGHYESHRHFFASVTQKEREPLEGILAFLLNEGIPSTIRKTDDGYYELRTLGGLETTAKLVLNTEPYIKTQNKRDQIQKLKERLMETPKRLTVHRRRARQILGLVPS